MGIERTPAVSFIVMLIHMVAFYLITFMRGEEGRVFS